MVQCYTTVQQTEVQCIVHKYLAKSNGNRRSSWIQNSGLCVFFMDTEFIQYLKNIIIIFSINVFWWAKRWAEIGVLPFLSSMGSTDANVLNIKISSFQEFLHLFDCLSMRRSLIDNCSQIGWNCLVNNQWKQIKSNQRSKSKKNIERSHKICLICQN